ncbi:coiled-coil domain-containing protein R3HCC1L-like isoform X2 [Argopecten irradians]|uniref:coiled-coil domain-containing protein R3HCC1L-like isoform X2 n=1 Tax=Argopecten irradians TaxID=31199 RepID=UPI0037202D78
MSFLNRILSPDEEQFIEFVHKDLEHFLKCYTTKSVLLFPPLSSFHRLLIHKAAEDYQQLHTFSIGQGELRRTTVCLEEDFNSCPHNGEGLMSLNQPPSARGRGRGRWSSPGSQYDNRQQNRSSRGTDDDKWVKDRYEDGLRDDRLQDGFRTDERHKDDPTAVGQNDQRRPRGVDTSPISHGDKPSRRGRGQRSRNKRPDVQIYVPRGRRQQQVMAVNQKNYDDPALHPCDRDPHSTVTDKSSGKYESNTANCRILDGDYFSNSPDDEYRTERRDHGEGDSRLSDVIDHRTTDRCSARNKILGGQNSSFSPDSHGVSNKLTEQSPPQSTNSTSMKKVSQGKKPRTKFQVYVPPHQKNQCSGQLRETSCQNVPSSGESWEREEIRDSNADGTNMISDSHQRTKVKRVKLDSSLSKHKSEDKMETEQNMATSLSDRQDEQCRLSNEPGDGVSDVHVPRPGVEDRCVPVPNVSDLHASGANGSKIHDSGSDTSNIHVSGSNVSNIYESGSDASSIHVSGPNVSKIRIPSSRENDCDDLNANTGNDHKTCSSVNNPDTSSNNLEINKESEMNVRLQSKTLSQTEDECQNVLHSDSCVERTIEGTPDVTVEPDLTTFATASPRVNLTKNDEQNYQSETDQTPGLPDDVTVTKDQESEKSSGAVFNTHVGHLDNQSDIPESMDVENDISKDVKEKNKDENSDEKKEKEEEQPPSEEKEKEKPESSIDEGKMIADKCHGEEGKEEVCTGEEQENEGDEESWDKMFDDEGECLDPVAMEELTSAIGKVKIKKPIIDYFTYKPRDPDLSRQDLGHVIEIYDFPAEFKTEDLMSAFQQFKTKGFDIKWVDDTHALGVFNSAIAAQSALTLTHPLLKVRAMSEATRQSKEKAKRCVEFLLPYKARPETSALTARRLVTGALGLASKVSREQRDLERQKLRQAKEKKKLMKKQKDDIWEGTYTSGKLETS